MLEPPSGRNFPCVFGLSFFEVAVIGFVAVLAAGPERLARMAPTLHDLGAWIRKHRKK